MNKTLNNLTGGDTEGRLEDVIKELLEVLKKRQERGHSQGCDVVFPYLSAVSDRVLHCRIPIGHRIHFAAHNQKVAMYGRVKAHKLMFVLPGNIPHRLEFKAGRKG